MIRIDNLWFKLYGVLKFGFSLYLKSFLSNKYFFLYLQGFGSFDYEFDKREMNRR